MRHFGLIGFPLSHSFSKGYFAAKFEKEGITDAVYDTYPIPEIGEFPNLTQKIEGLVGLNVTIPYKEQVIPFLDELHPAAAAMGAVNTILFKNGKSKGFNTDVYGFQKSLEPLLKAHHTHALVLGTGGASKAVVYALNELGISWKYVSRTGNETQLSYQDLTPEIIAQHTLIINTSPVGMYPNVSDCPEIPYDAIGSQHLLYDLVYNPAETLFLTKGKAQGAEIKNGLEMLHLQAERAWEIWSLERPQTTDRRPL
jgi:shikimate dehydrogenase